MRRPCESSILCFALILRCAQGHGDEEQGLGDDEQSDTSGDYEFSRASHTISRTVLEGDWVCEAVLWSCSSSACLSFAQRSYTRAKTSSKICAMIIRRPLRTGMAEIQDGAGPAKNFKTVGSRNIKNVGLAKIRKGIVKNPIFKSC